MSGVSAAAAGIAGLRGDLKVWLPAERLLGLCALFFKNQAGGKSRCVADAAAKVICL